MPSLQNIIPLFLDTLTGHIILVIFLFVMLDERILWKRLKKLPFLVLSPLIGTAVAIGLFELMPKDRFVEVYNQGVVNVVRIIVDTETGVNYVLGSHNKASGTGMTVLVDPDGKPVVTPIS